MFNNFDKLMGAIIIALFTIVVSINLGDYIYFLSKIPVENAYTIEITESDSGAPAKKGLPDVLDLKTIFASYNLENGEKVFKKCAVCHTPNKGGENKVGPNLWQIVGNSTASNSSFNYSKAMLARKEDGKKWTYEELYRYLYSPKKYVPGTKMAFTGIKNDDDRRDVIAYLRTLADAPLQLP